MTTPTTLERLARTLRESADTRYMGGQESQVLVRALLAALMEPSEAMVEAGVAADWGGTLGSRVGNAHKAILQSILDEADNTEG